MRILPLALKAFYPRLGLVRNQLVVGRREFIAFGGRAGVGRDQPEYIAFFVKLCSHKVQLIK